MAIGFNRKGQMMHMASGLDLVIILIGIIIGLFIAWWGLNNGYLPAGMFCPAPAAAPF